MGLRAVIVDDSQVMRRALRMMLEARGVAVVGEGGNGLEAVQLCEKHRPDFVTLDIIMPKLEGLGALKLIRERHPQIKVVMATALATEAKVRDCMAAGATSYIVKPFNEEKVAEVLAALESGAGEEAPSP